MCCWCVESKIWCCQCIHGCVFTDINKIITTKLQLCYEPRYAATSLESCGKSWIKGVLNSVMTAQLVCNIASFPEVWKHWANYRTFWPIFITIVLLPIYFVYSLVSIYQTFTRFICMTGCFHTTGHISYRKLNVIIQDEWLSEDF